MDVQLGSIHTMRIQSLWKDVVPATHLSIHFSHVQVQQLYEMVSTYIYIYIYTPVVPHKAVAEVSRIGNL